MRVLAAFAGLLLSSCELPCTVSSECEQGERCSVDGECIQGCQDDSDCDSARAICERSTGLCRLTPGAPVDFGLLDADLSDASDGSSDASADGGGGTTDQG